MTVHAQASIGKVQSLNYFLSRRGWCLRLQGVGVLDSFVTSSYFKRGGGLKIKALLWFKKPHQIK